MRKLYFILLICFTFPLLVAGQSYNNEWIPFVSGQPYSAQQYFRVSVWKEGIYRITYNDLLLNGVNPSNWFNPERYQLFGNGKEQFIKVVDGNTQNVFEPGDYIEFYAKGTDGKLDGQLYDTITSQPDPGYSLFNDTASYFLTYNIYSTTNKRMIVETDINFSGYTPESSFIHDEYQGFHGSYNIGYRDQFGIADNSYTAGEGSYIDKVSYGNSATAAFTISKFIAGGASPEINLNVMGQNANSHPFEIKGGGSTLLNSIFYGYTLEFHKFNPTNLPASGNYNVQLFPLQDVNNQYNENYMQWSFVKMRYPRSCDFNGEGFPQYLNINAATPKAYLELPNVSAANPLFYIVGSDTVRQITLNNNGTTVRCLVPVNGAEQRCMLLDASQLYSATGNLIIKAVNTDPDPSKFSRFNNFLVSGANADFLMISNKAIWSGALDYYNYRANSGHTPLLVDIDELYDQFAWGIEKHPLAIRNFADYMIDNINPGPKFLLMLGKSVVSMDARSGSAYAKNLVPTFGEPASDAMITARLNSNAFKPELATGRISAANNADVTAYLNKLIAFENNQLQPPAPWMKNVLHFGGGTDITEQQSLANKLNVYKQIVEDTLFGGVVTTFLKSSTDPIQINLSQFLQAKIDSGCSMMTFYGHAAGTSFDIATDQPENYNNKDRYPVLLANSCYVGDIHSTGRLLNERFVLTPDKGAIAFIAVPDKGIENELDAYSLQFHQLLFKSLYGKSVAECMKATVDSVITISPYFKNVCMNMTLHGDPALIMNSYALPDYAITDPNIFFEPKVVTSELDSFTVKIAIANLGKNTSESMHVLLARTYPGQTTSKDTIFQVPYITNQDTFAIKLPVDISKGAGFNFFRVTVNVLNEVTESNPVSNNTASATLQINSTDIDPVYPQEFAIIPDAQPTLKATTADLFAKAKNYRFELDTTPFFNSPSLQTSTIQNAFGIISWQVNSTLDSNRAYYWRVANDSILSADTSISKRFQWKVSSFLYKPNTTGWSQSHWYQFKGTELANMIRVDSTRMYKFVQSQYALVMTHIGYNPSYDINGVNKDYGGCTGAQQIGVAILDSIDFENPWEADSCVRFFGNYNYYNCNTGAGCATRTRPDRYFLFDTSPAGQASLNNLISSQIPLNNYVLAWNVWPTSFSTNPGIVNTFVSKGVIQMGGIADNEKFMLFYKNGDPSTVIFQKGVFPDSTLRINYSLTRDWDKGYMSSTKAGPALQWTSAHWAYNSTEPFNSPDSISLQIIGITKGGTETILVDSIAATNTDFALSSIDAKIYPYLKFRAYKQDSQFRTPPQINRWQIYYEPVPEGALNTAYYSFYKDSIQEGDFVKIDMAFSNISNVGMDTLLVDYYLFDSNNNRHNLGSVRQRRDLPAGDTIMTHFNFSTRNLVGTTVLWIEANPNFDQPEQYHFNNTASLRFNVTKDITNPLLDVTFDGTHILNGDLISAKPVIQIKLLDENKFIALNDTSNFRISLKTPSGQVRYLNFEPSIGANTSAELLKWQPAALPKNSFIITYSPNFAEDGIYELTAQATDESGNISGNVQYRIQFEIVNKSTITSVVNYPNPFSTSTRFVFVLTGSEIPTDFKVQIMTVTGKIVREITRDEIGAIHIGRNITEYAWNGKDEFGDQLANGVYIYRVVTSLNGANIDKRETEADKYFKKGWGKMYLLR
ncbi:hypothetical protein BH11BAC2_BH11BAC2_02080 [soil metagenome]